MAALLLRHNKIFLFLLASFLLSSTAAAYEFRVGGPKGWAKPTGDVLQNYNHWATMNRFHVGDSLYFKYENDSVLVVDKKAYKECNTAEPLLKFVDGNTVFTLDRPGLFFFVSGQPGHCESGERLIVRVMAEPGVVVVPAPALSPEEGTGSGDGTAAVNSGPAAFKNSAVASAIIAALGSAALTISNFV
ncbi:mavicyanin-like [Canna indica]|uniref:Mavicyanin-like n=1 Tax=Canna indica TaxID=4628 RepID=A0AAQ3KDJ0_9LILI|nr:mavicyanin-like [Canna indica]